MFPEHLHPTARNIRFAKELRERQTHAERILWRKLRARRFHGYKFRRQVPIGPFIVDFFCAEYSLIIEIDGSSHYQIGAREYDQRRQRYLEKEGFKVLRFGHRQTIESLEFVLIKIGEILESLSYPSP